MECRYCKKKCKNGNSIRNHERLCKNNPNRQIPKLNGIIQYNKKRKELSIPGTNQYTKAKVLGLPTPIITEETRIKLSKANKGKKLTNEQRERISLAMQKVVEKYPDSYTKNNVVGRVKNILYNGIKLKGSWEVMVAEWLDSNNIKWEHETKHFEYEWNGKRKYYPDFYLPELDIFLEVKGYKTERDLAKWKVVPNLKIVSLSEIKDIKSGTFDLMNLGFI